MFDWPEQTQTSPTSTSSKVTVFFPLTVIVCGPPAGSGSSVTDHLPSSPAFAVFDWSAMLTVTSSPGSALPQTLSFCFCCKTMWLPKMFGSETSARAGGPPARNAAARPRARVRVDLFTKAHVMDSVLCGLWGRKYGGGRPV